MVIKKGKRADGKKRMRARMKTTSSLDSLALLRFPNDEIFDISHMEVIAKRRYTPLYVTI